MRSTLLACMRVFFVSAVASCFCLAAFGQEGTATLNGRVTDPGGLAVAAAKLQAVNVATNITYAAQTNELGLYSLPNLPPGSYRVLVSKEGFEQIVKPGVDLHVSDIIALNFSLQVGSVTQSVTVEGGAPLVETTASSLGGLVNDQEIADLPLNGRNYIDLSLLQPGVARNTNNGALGGMVGTYYSSNGAPTISNSYLLDGTSIVNQSGQGTSSMAGTTLGVDGILEYKVITNTFGAEYGMTMGSQMVMVSKGGTNKFHGDVFEFLRNSALNSRNYFDAPKIPELRKNNFGGSFGGPIKKNKMFFYAVYEGLQQNLGFTVLDQVPAAGCHGASLAKIGSSQCPQLGSTSLVTIANSQIAALLSLFPNPGPSASNIAANTFTFPTSTKMGVNYGQIRIDNDFSASDTFFGRYTTDESNIDSANGSSTSFIGAAYPGFRGLAGSRNQFITLSENHIFSTALLNTARVSFSRTNFYSASIYPSLTGIPTFISGQPLGSVTVGGIAAIGAFNGTTLTTHTQNIYSFADDLYYTRGKHALRFGVLFNRYNQGTNSPLRTSGQVSYSGVATFLEGIPSSYQAATPGSDFNRDYIYNTLGFYVQDDWHVASRLTLNLGLRYEFMTTPWELNDKGWAIRNYNLNPSPTQGAIMVNKSLLNFSPRLGLAWDVFGNGKTALRSGFGIYYDVANLGEAITLNADGQPPLATASSVNNSSTNAVVTFPIVFTSAQMGHAAQGAIFYNANQPHVLQYNVTIQQQLPRNTALSIAYVGSRGAHLWQAREGNPTIPTYTSASGVLYWANSTAVCSTIVPSCRVNPNFDSLVDDYTGGDSWYNALQVSVTKRLSSGLEFQAAYTYSHSLDTTEGQIYGVDCSGTGMDHGVNPYNPIKNLGPSCWDLRHNLRFSLLYHFPTVKSEGLLSKAVNGWWIGNIVSVEGGFPFTPNLSTNRSNSGVINAQPDWANIGTATVAPGQVGPDGHTNTTTKTFIPFNENTVILGTPAQWFNPLMFDLQPMVPCPNNTAVTCGTLGTVTRGLLRGPGLGTWDFSLVKDTAAPILGEHGSVEFRAEFFNILNRTNFGMPTGTVFSGNTSDLGSYSESPLSTAGQITTTATTARQIQFALKVLF